MYFHFYPKMCTISRRLPIWPSKCVHVYQHHSLGEKGWCCQKYPTQRSFNAITQGSQVRQDQWQLHLGISSEQTFAFLFRNEISWLTRIFVRQSFTGTLPRKMNKKLKHMFTHQISLQRRRHSLPPCIHGIGSASHPWENASWRKCCLHQNKVSLLTWKKGDGHPYSSTMQIWSMGNPTSTRSNKIKTSQLIVAHKVLIDCSP